MTARGLIRSAGWAFLLSSNRDGGMLQGSHRSCWISFVVLVGRLVSATPLWAQHDQQHQASVQQAVSPDHRHHGTVGDQTRWEGSVAGIAYSEFNHHLTGMLVLIIGLSELRQALAIPFWAWTRFFLPGALLSSGFFLFVWSDHEAWPIGSLSFMQTFFGSDSEIFQHKSYALLSLTVGAIELLRRFRQLGHAGWATPLPVFAIIGGLMLFGHSHGLHPSADKIALDHAIMGTMAVTAGSCKLLSDWFRSPSNRQASRWELFWAGLLLLIGIQLIIYAE
jgi:hypothetical protein